MSKLEVTVVVGEYEDAQGKTQKRYLKVGNAWDKGQYMSVKLDTIPAGNTWNGWLTIKAPMEKQWNQEKTERQRPEIDDGEIPF